MAAAAAARTYRFIALLLEIPTGASCPRSVA
jgi:hypothetical protein